MTKVKERLIGAITVMKDEDAEKLWNSLVDEYTWDDEEDEADGVESDVIASSLQQQHSPEEEMDEMDLQISLDIEDGLNPPQYYSDIDVLKELGIDE